MKKLLLLAVFSLFLIGCSNEVDVVKDGVLAFDPSRTVEECLDNSLDDLEWRNFESDNRQVVEVVGILKKDAVFKSNSGNMTTTQLYNSLVGSFLPEGMLPYKGDKVLLQFIINKDDTFELSYGEITSPQGKKREADSLKQLDVLYSIAIGRPVDL